MSTCTRFCFRREKLISLMTMAKRIFCCWQSKIFLDKKMKLLCGIYFNVFYNEIRLKIQSWGMVHDIYSHVSNQPTHFFLKIELATPFTHSKRNPGFLWVPIQTKATMTGLFVVISRSRFQHGNKDSCKPYSWALGEPP